MMNTAKKHNLLNAEGSFQYQRWNPQTQTLQITNQPAVTPARMLKYVEQLQALTKDQHAVMKFQSLKPSESAKVVPWLLQVALRQDELQILMMQLQGSTVWNLLGLQVKPHNLHQSRPAQVLRELMGKGHQKGHHKGKGPKA